MYVCVCVCVCVICDLFLTFYSDHPGNRSADQNCLKNRRSVLR